MSSREPSAPPKGPVEAVEKAVEKLDPTAPRRQQPDRGQSLRRPAMQALVRRAQGSLPADLVRRFIDTELMAQSAALALYAILSLAPLLLILTDQPFNDATDCPTGATPPIGAPNAVEVER